MRIPIICLLSFLSYLSFAQNIGGFSPKLDWKSIDHEKHRIIFHPSNESSAHEFSHYFDTLNQENYSIGPKRKKIPLVLRHQNTTPNGFVAFTPFRSEIFMTPHPNNFVLGSLDWNYLLAIHEYQHVLQMSNSLNGISKWAYFIGGEIFWSSTLGLSIPDWFFEGDAVRAESEMTLQGRWRIPNFFNGYRQLAFDDNFYRYSVARNGSFRKDVPNHYALGSIMVGYGKDMKKGKFWETVFREASAYQAPLYSFSRAMKRNSGFNVKTFYENACAAYASSLNSIKQPQYQNAWPSFPKDDLGRESLFVLDNESNDVYFRFRSNDAIPILMRQGQDKNEKVIELPFQIDGVYDIHQQQLITSASFVHPRWNQESYQDLIQYDLQTKRKIRLTKGERFFAPIWADDGNHIFCVQINENGESNLVKLDSSGAVKEIYPNDYGYYISYPKQFSKDSLILNLRDLEGRNCLAFFDLNDHSYAPFTSWNYHQTGIPHIHNDSVVFSASYDGIDHIYVFHQGKISQLTFGQEPHYMPSIQKGNLYFQSYNLKDSRYKSIALSDIKAKAVDQISDSPLSPFTLNDSLTINPVDFSAMSDSLENYHKHKHLFNLHSWRPIIEDPVFKLELTAEDVLSTFRGEIAARYNRNEKGFGQEARIIYGQYFTVFSLNFKNQARTIKQLNQTSLKFNESELTLKANWPLNYTSGIYSRLLNFSTEFGFKTFYDAIEIQPERELWSTTFSQQFLIAKRRALKNISSPLGYSANWHQSFSINENVSQYTFYNALSLKALSKNHNLVLDLDVQFQTNPNQYAFENTFFVSRGYNSYQHDFQARMGFNYHFPILYPDIGVLGLIYIYRLRANVFTDIGQIRVDDIEAELLSGGSELIFDLNLFNQFPMSIGVRYSRILENPALSRKGNENQFELFIPLSRFN